MNKLYAIIYSLIFLVALTARVISCTMEALIASRIMDLSFFKEVFLYNWNDSNKYTSVDEHLDRIKVLWNE